MVVHIFYMLMKFLILIQFSSFSVSAAIPTAAQSGKAKFMETPASEFSLFEFILHVMNVIGALQEFS